MISKVRRFFRQPRIQEIDASVRHYSMSYVHDGLDGKYHKPNMETLTRESLRIQYESQQGNLVIMNRTMIVALIGIFVSIGLGAIAILSKPDVRIEVQKTSTEISEL